MLYEKFLKFLFYGLVLELLKNSKNVRSLCGDEKCFVVKNCFEFFFLFFDCPRKPHMLLLADRIEYGGTSDSKLVVFLFI